MAGYSGTPLPRKLGIEPHGRLALVSPPPGFLDSLEPLPEGVLEATGGPAEATFYHPPGHRYGPLRTATDRAGYVIAEGTTRQEALERARTAVEAVRFEVA